MYRNPLIQRVSVHLGWGGRSVAGDLDAAGTRDGPDVPVGARCLVEALDGDRSAAGAAGVRPAGPACLAEAIAGDLSAAGAAVVEWVDPLGSAGLDVSRARLRVALVGRLADHRVHFPGGGPGPSPPRRHGCRRDLA